jgi:hypothetical protein
MQYLLACDVENDPRELDNFLFLFLGDVRSNSNLGRKQFAV